MKYKYLFGPIPSRRLGISLGVDLVPFKVCSLDCVYCETGKTNCHTLERREYIPTKEILNELKDYLSKDPEIDIITFSGAGEPTLHSGIGEIIKFIKKSYPQYKLCLITNSTLLYNENVLEEILPVDLILPSFDAFSDEVFKKINRPEQSLENDFVKEGLLNLSKKFKGKIWLEVFILPGINDSDEEIEKIKEFVLKLNPDQVQLNTLDRPGTENWVEPADKTRMNEIAEIMKPLNVSVIAKFKLAKSPSTKTENIEKAIIGAISRRPCTLEDLIVMTGFSENEIGSKISELVKMKKIYTEIRDRGEFYKLMKQ